MVDGLSGMSGIDTVVYWRPLCHHSVYACKCPIQGLFEIRPVSRGSDVLDRAPGDRLNGAVRSHNDLLHKHAEERPELLRGIFPLQHG